MPSDFITYTFGKLIEDLRKIITAGVAGVVNEVIEKRLSEIAEIRNRLMEIERILNEQTRRNAQCEENKESVKVSPVVGAEKEGNKCQFEGCDREAVSRGYCKNHYYQLKRKGELQNIDKSRTKRPCLIEGCERYAISKGLCKNHYYQLRRGTIVYENGKYVKKS
ncbi:MAG: hypothetical protein ACP5KG_10310 [Myxococcota bacterium]